MLSQVHADDIPMPIPDGASPPFAWTLQPSGTTFDPPIEITYPNMSGLPAGSIAYFLSFNHATSRFEIVATGHVTDDGSKIISDPGAGLTVAGWGCNCPPYSVTGDCDFDPCEGDASGCCQDRCCQGGPCCENPDPCCDAGDPCCGNPDRCCNPNNPCCGSDDPCCNKNDPCCGNPDPCCNDDNPCCAAAAAFASAPAPTDEDESVASLISLVAADPCCGEGADDPCCNNPDPCCPCNAAGTLCCGDHCCEVECCGTGCCFASEPCCGGTTCCPPERCCGNGECCAQDCEGCLDNGSVSGGMIDVDRDPVCVGDTITFTVSGVVDSGGIKRVDCTAKMPIPAVTPTYKWTVTKPDGTTVKGSGSVATILATKPGTYSIIFTAMAERECPPSDITIGPQTAEALEVDLDVDSDNNNGTGSPNRSTAEDAVELTAPGKILCLNDDDDDNNDVPDKDQEPPPGADNDLVQMVAELKQSAPSMSKWQLVYDAAVVQIYEGDRATIVPTSQIFNMPLAPNPRTFWIEGIAPTIGGPTSISFNVDLDGDGTFDCSDEVVASVVKVDLDVDSDNDGTIASADDQIEETTPGKFVGVNDDDDNLDGSPDQNDSGANLGLNEDDLVAMDLDTDFTPPDPNTATWTLTWMPANSIQVWENSDKSGQMFSSGISTPWTTFNGLPSTVYVEGLNAGSVTITLLVQSPELSPGCKDIVTMTVVRVELFRDALGTQVLDDWPEDTMNGFPQSPKHLFAKSDDLFVRVTTPSGLGDGFFAVQVTSDSDPAGVTLKLDETSPGVHQNTAVAGELLRLSNATGENAMADTIKVVEEEVLSFNLSIRLDMQPLDIAKDVMVDRAEGAGGGINRFYGAATGDQALLEQRLWGDAEWWENGNFDAINTSNAEGLILRALIKNAGDNAPASREADFLQASLHGSPSGDLLLEGTSSTLIIDPDGGTAVGIAPTDWNDDLDWVALAACSQLHDGQACHTPTSPTGRFAWASAAFSGTRPVHGILGAICPLNGDLTQQWARFWQRVIDDEEPLITAYGSSMELANPLREENWAALWITNMNYTQDRLMRMGRDANSSSIAGFGYLHLANINLKIVCGRQEDDAVFWNEGATSVLADTASLKSYPAKLRASIRLVSVVPSFDPGFACTVHRRPDNAVEFRGGNFYTDSLDGSTLTEENVTTLAHQWCADRIPNFETEYSLIGVSPVKYHEYSRTFEPTSVTTPGYLVTYSHQVDGVRIMHDTLRVRIVGDRIASSLVKMSSFYQQETWPTARSFANARTAFERATPAICQHIGANHDDITVLAVELAYWIDKAGTDTKDTVQPSVARLAYHIVLSDGECEDGSCRTQKWMAIVDAIDGQMIGVSRY